MGDDSRDRTLRRDAHRIEKWSVGWILLSLAMWGWFGYRLLLANDPELDGQT